MSEPAFTVRSGQRLGKVVLDELRDRLLSGHYAVGSRISIEEVKAEFGVSKQPVMDAMRRLEATGIVEIVPQSGCRVAHYSVQEIKDFFNLFGRFEGEIAAAAASRRSEDQLAEMDAAWQRIEELKELADPRERSRGYRFQNREFHLVIHRMAHSPVMADLSERMWDLSDFFISTIGGPQPLSDSLHHRNHDHDVIRTVIRSRNADIARVAMESHIVSTVALFEASLGDTG
ncbi:GntR family transcriptional regulator [Nocardioides limicola]|uniref:GntR family transcriptional regulator n=1 Tax=Nocardioides limicola TaxID=2803368 RepID=UPI00193B1B54|nr:GntR family transcriptional regulator [Nocardioides sp. DJM-14]